MKDSEYPNASDSFVETPPDFLPSPEPAAAKDAEDAAEATTLRMPRPAAPEPRKERLAAAFETGDTPATPPPLPEGARAQDYFLGGEDAGETISDGPPVRRSRGAEYEAEGTAAPRTDLPVDPDALTERLPRTAGGHQGTRSHIRNFIQQYWGGPQEHRGKRIGDYELIEEIGRGSMGAVFKATQVSLSRVVALKMIISGQFASKSNRIRFRREAEVSAELRHPNIVAIHDFGEFEGQPYYTMDFVEGRDLAEMVSDRPMAWQHAAYYMHKVSLAVAYAHERGIIHRDLKPQNVLVDQFDEPRILDFGLARRLDADGGVTMSTSVIGSPSYMPPEQALGQNNLVGPQSDIYGLGAILYELLTIRPPILAPTVAKTLEMVVNFEPIPPNRANPSIPDDLNTVVLKCLEKAPERRYQTAYELADELARVLDDRPILAKPIGLLEHGYRWCRRNRAVAAIAAISMALLIASSIVSTSLWVRAELSLDRLEEQRRRADVAARNAEEARALALQAQANAEGEMRKAQEALNQMRLAQAQAAQAGQRADTAEAGQQELEKRLEEESVRARTAQREAEAFRERSGFTDISQDLLIAMDRLDRGLPAEALSHLARQVRAVPGDQLSAAVTLSMLARETWARPLVPPIFVDGRAQLRGMALSADQETLVAWTGEGLVSLWDLADGALGMQQDLRAPVLAVHPAPDGAWAIAALEGGGLVRVERGSSSPVILEGGLPAPLPGVSPLHSVFSVSPDGVHAAWPGGAGEVLVVETASGSSVRTLPAPKSAASTEQDFLRNIAYSPDGRALVLTRGRAFSIFPAGGAQPVVDGAPVEAGIRQVGFSADGSRFFLLMGEGGPETAASRLEVRETATGQPVGTPIGTPRGILRACLNVNGSRATLLHEGNTITNWMVEFGRSLGESVQLAPQHPASALGAAGFAAISESAGLQFIPALRPGSPVNFPASDRLTRALWVSPRGDRVITLREDHGLRVYDTSFAESLPALLAHGRGMTGAIFSPSGKTVLSYDSSGSAQFWEADSGELIRKLPSLGAPIRVAAINPGGTMVVFGLEDGKVIAWDATGTGKTVELQDSGQPIAALAFSRDGNLLAAATTSNTRHVWDVRTTARVDLGEPSPRGVLLNVGLAPGTLPQGTPGMEGDPDDDTGGMGERPRRPGGPGGMGQPGRRPGGRAPTLEDRLSMVSPALKARENYEVNELMFSEDGRFLATLAPLCVHVYDLQAGKLLDLRYAVTPEAGSADFLGKVEATAGAPFSTELNARLRRFYGEHAQDLRVWDLAVVRPLTGRLDIGAMPDLTGFSPDGTLFYVAVGETLRLWNAGSGEPVSRPLVQSAAVTQALFDAEGKRLAAVTRGGKVQVYDTTYGLPIGRAHTLPAAILNVAFSPDGQGLLVTCEDGFVRLLEAPLPQGDTPAWLAQLAESVAGVQVDAEGRMMGLENLYTLRGEAKDSLADLGDHPRLAAFGQWFFQPVAERNVSSTFRMTTSEFVNRALFVGQPEELLRAAAVNPEHEAVQLRLVEPARWVDQTRELLKAGRTADAFACLQVATLLAPQDQRLAALMANFRTTGTE